MEDIELAQILWDYMHLNHKLKKADCIIVLGTSDASIADVAIELYFKGYANKIIFSGGLGKITKNTFDEPEADKFAKIAISKGVPKENIYIENKSTNTGENFIFTKKLIKEKGLNIKTCILVCKPYNEKRVYAAFQKNMPEYDAIVASRKISCKEYHEIYLSDNTTFPYWIDVMVGDVQRMKVFAEKGWQVEVDMPKNVWSAYLELVKKGYKKFVISD